MVNPKISVIIPIYNTGIYLEETLMSLVNQSIFEDIEVLMVDDGSTDQSPYIIEKFALDFDNFHAFHKENEGQGVARNYGLKYAKGDYVHFMDSDDFILRDSYEKLYNLAISKDYDFVVGNVMKFSNYNCWDDVLFKHSFKGLNGNTEFESVNEHPFLVWDTSAANKLYKRDFLINNNIKFIDEKVFFEDILFAFESYINAESFCYYDGYFYYWRVRKNLSSVTQQNKTFRNFNDRLYIIGLMKDLIPESCLNEDTLDELYWKWLFHDIKMFLKSISEIPSAHHEELVDKVYDIIKDIPESVMEKLPSYHRVIYRMVENKDIKALINFTPFDKQLKDENVDYKLDKKYESLIDFERDVLSEDLVAKATNIDGDGKNILIDFDLKVNYVYDQLDFEALLVDENNNEDALKIKNNHIILPYSLLKSKKNVKILIRSLDKEAYLRNNDRGSILFKDFDFEIGIGLNRILNINVRKVSSDCITVDEIILEDEEFIFKCDGRLDDVFIENVVTFERVTYSQNSDYTFKIPYNDIIKTPIKKWELKSSKLLELSQSFTFFRDYDEIVFSNKRNIILIRDNIYDKFEKLNKLNKKNIKLSRENKKLKKTLKQDNSNKIKKFANKFRL